jgi:hypothetical protein
LQEELQNKTVTDARLDKETGDLLFHFAESVKFQAFNFTCYEIWDISFPDGTVEYSNYSKSVWEDSLSGAFRLQVPSI